MGPRVRLHQLLVRVEAVAVLRLVGAVHAVAVVGAELQVGYVTVPDLVGVLRQGVARDSCWPLSSKRLTSTLVAWAENSAMITPSPVKLTPRGNGSPSRM